MNCWKPFVLLCLCPAFCFSQIGARAFPAAPRESCCNEPQSPTSQTAGVWIENRGQWLASVRFACNVAGTRIFLESDALVMDVPHPQRAGSRVSLRMAFEDACADAVVEGLERTEGTYNYFIGNDPANWRENVPGYRQVRMRGIYTGIDLLVDADDGRLEYDFLVHPGADLSQVVVRVEGASALRSSGDQVLEFETPLGPVVQSSGLSWQTLASGELHEVKAHWIPLGSDRFGVAVPDRDPSLALVIDPELAWSTYLGSPSTWATAVATDVRGDVFVVGRTDALSFPHTPGAYQSPKGSEIVFVSKFHGQTGAMVFSSLFGGSTNNQRPTCVTADRQGRVTVGGYTFATDFPTTPFAFDQVNTAPTYAGFVTQLTGLGDQLEFSTYIEGPQTGGYVVSVQSHPAGGVLVGGAASGSDFPTTPGSYQTQHQGQAGDGFILHLDATGSTLLHSTLLGGTKADDIEKIAVDEAGIITVAGLTGSDDFPTTVGAYAQTKSPQAATALFVSRFDPQLTSLLWSTYLGGLSVNEYDGLGGMGIDASGAVTVGGSTNSPIFPTTPGVLKSAFPAGVLYQGFLTRLDPLGQHLMYSTYFGDDINGGISGLAVDPSGMPTLSASAGPGYPVTPGAYDTTQNGAYDIGVSRIDPSGRKLYYSTFLGGPASDIGSAVALSKLGRATMVGYTYTPGGYPTTLGAFQPTFVGGQTDAIVTSLDLLLQGVELHGTGTPSCHSPLTANATEMPQAGAARFGLYLSGAPRSSLGFCLISTAASPVGIPYFNATLWIAPASIVRRFAVHTDAAGFAETSAPLGPGTTGLELWAQYVMRNSADCPAGGIVASPAVHLTVQ